MKKAVLFALALIMLLHPLPLLSGEHTSNPNQVKLPPVRAIPGLTEEDKFPLGCVDCHINMPERNQDERIGTLMSRWAEKVEPGLLEKAQAVAPAGITLKGVHPKVTRSLENIPTACLRCHSKTSKKTPPRRRCCTPFICPEEREITSLQFFRVNARTATRWTSEQGIGRFPVARKGEVASDGYCVVFRLPTLNR